jgi:hypothetical protein
MKFPEKNGLAVLAGAVDGFRCLETVLVDRFDGEVAKDVPDPSGVDTQHQGGDGLRAPALLGARLVRKFELGDSVHALDDPANRFHCAEYSVGPLT